MSIINSTLDHQKNTVSDADPLLKTMLDLNDVFKDSIKEYQSGSSKNSIIIRCETLPVIEAVKNQMIQLFNDLISMIMNFPPAGSRLFLYVDCEEVKPEKLNGSANMNLREFTIKFHTNISTNDIWKKENEKLLVSCEQLVLSHKGSFGVKNINNTGCLFSLTFPGKLK